MNGAIYTGLHAAATIIHTQVSTLGAPWLSAKNMNLGGDE